jgi:hypothetical protein
MHLGQRRFSWAGAMPGAVSISAWVAAFGLATVAGCGSKGADGDGGASLDRGRPADAGGGDGRACANSLDCGADQVCDQQARRCVQCVSDPDCATGMRCVANVCMAAPPTCHASADCATMPGQPVCDVPTGRCVRCLTAADCPASNDCTSETCVSYTMCMNSLACPSGQVCDTARMRCAQCVGDNDCATDQKCASDVCRKKCASDNMCTPMGMLCDIAHGYCVSCLATTDCKAAEYCSNGACLADVCTQGTSSCNNNAVVHCKSDGSGFDPPVTCGTGQGCVVTAGAATCKSQVCTPTVTSCDSAAMSEKVLVCSADGLTSTVKTDCAASSQVCVAGACATVMCRPGLYFCQGQDVRFCSAKGDSSTVMTTCTDREYCSTTTLDCQLRVCMPNQPACNGNVATTCNGDGSGYVAGGTSCAPKLCSVGACVDVLFQESFEGNYDMWTVGTGQYTRSATATPGANGSTYALSMTKSANGLTLADGLSYTFSTPVQPASISYWVKTGTTGVAGLGYFRLLNGSEVLYYSYFTTPSSLTVAYGGGSYGDEVARANTWYHLELRNINWSTRTFDLYLDGNNATFGVTFAGTSTSINRIELFSSVATYTAYWDEIQFLP